MTPANLDEVVSYSDFSQEIPLRQLLIQESLEDLPEENFLLDVLSGELTVNESKMHVLPKGRY